MISEELEKNTKLIAKAFSQEFVKQYIELNVTYGLDPENSETFIRIQNNNNETIEKYIIGKDQNAYYIQFKNKIKLHFYEIEDFNKWIKNEIKLFTIKGCYNEYL